MTDIAAILIIGLGPYAGDLEPGQPFPLTRRGYDALPELYRRADDGTLEDLVVAMLNPVGMIEVLVDAIDYRRADEGGTDDLNGLTSFLTDPAWTLWPEWLAQAVGVNLRAAGITRIQPRDPDIAEAIATPVNGWRAGSAAALEVAARRHLTGNRTVRVRALMDPDPFVITVSTAAAETPDAALLRAAIEAVLPAGHVLELDNNVGNWAGIEALGSWAAVAAAGPWADLEQLYA